MLVPHRRRSDQAGWSNRFCFLALLVLYLYQPSVAAGKAQSRLPVEVTATEPGAPQRLRPIEFEGEFTDEDAPHLVREGHVTLRWSEIPGAAEYVVTDAYGNTVYRGRGPQAFVSGLPDGVYRFDVHAVGADGDVLAASTVPARVEVHHWPLLRAFGLFAVGLVVFLAVVGVIARATLSSAEPRSSPSGGEGSA